MTKPANPDQENPEQPDPLSATAMFLRALDESPQAKPASGGQARETSGAVSLPTPGRLTSPAEPPKPAAEPGEFTRIFGQIGGKPDESAAARATRVRPAPSSAPLANSLPSDPPGEFTRIFVKNAGAAGSRADENVQPKTSETPERAQGFSSPGVSDAASGGSTFTQFIKASAGASAGLPASGPVKEPRSLGGYGADANVARPLPERSTSPNADRSVTEMIAHLSSEKPASANSKDADVVPYREEPRRAFAPEPHNAPPAGVEAGGVTQIMQRLAPEPVKPVIDAPPVRPTPAPRSGPGEFTRMMSRDEVNAALGTPAAPAPVQPAPAPSASPFTPTVPPMPVPQVNAPVVAISPIAAAAPAPQFAAPAMPAAAMPAAPKPAAPAAPAPAAPKSKLEAMVPFLLLVNTFLLVVLLVVVIFLIKTK